MQTHEKSQVGAMSTQDHAATKPDVSKPGEPPPGQSPTSEPTSTPGGQKPTGVPGQTTGNP